MESQSARKANEKWVNSAGIQISGDSNPKHRLMPRPTNLGHPGKGIESFSRRRDRKRGQVQY